jgi:hypothetical protein
LQSPTRSFFFAAEIACREVYFFANWYGSEGRPLLFDMLNSSVIDTLVDTDVEEEKVDSDQD